MYKITIKGTAKTNYADLRGLDGISCGDEFSEYFWKDKHQDLINKGVRNGYMHFEYKDDKLWTIVEYLSNEELNIVEENLLLSYTQGQLSDGIGEGFEQEPCYYSEFGRVYISPWHRNQELVIHQQKINDEVLSLEKPKTLIEEDKWLNELETINGRFADLLERAEKLLKKYESDSSV